MKGAGEGRVLRSMGGAWPERGVSCLGRSLEWGRGFSQGVVPEVAWKDLWLGRALGRREGSCLVGEGAGVWAGRGVSRFGGAGSVNGGGAGRLREDFSLRARRAVTRGQTTEVTKAQRGEATPGRRCPSAPWSPHTPCPTQAPSPRGLLPVTLHGGSTHPTSSSPGTAALGAALWRRTSGRPAPPAPGLLAPSGARSSLCVSSNHVPLPVPSRAARAPPTRWPRRPLTLTLPAWSLACLTDQLALRFGAYVAAHAPCSVCACALWGLRSNAPQNPGRSSLVPLGGAGGHP